MSTGEAMESAVASLSLNTNRVFSSQIGHRCDEYAFIAKPSVSTPLVQPVSLCHLLAAFLQQPVSWSSTALSRHSVTRCTGILIGCIAAIGQKPH